MTARGIYQMAGWRGAQTGIEVRPQKLRHHFSHTWLDNGGAEGDLIPLNGSAGPQMLALYGRSARAALRPPLLRPRD